MVKKTRPSSKKTSPKKPAVIRRKKTKFNWDVRTWNLAPSLSPATNAMIRPINVIYATIPVVLASIV